MPPAITQAVPGVRLPRAGIPGPVYRGYHMALRRRAGGSEYDIIPEGYAGDEVVLSRGGLPSAYGCYRTASFGRGAPQRQSLLTAAIREEHLLTITQRGDR